MFDLHNISLNNFRSYRGEHFFEFPTSNGLYFLTGKNLAEPSLGANGAGKSTLLDAITWILYGRTTRGLKASEVISWGATSCQGALELTVSKKFIVKRTQKPNGLFLNNKPLDQEELQKHIRLNFESFLYAVLNPQFGQSFFSLSPSEKLGLFSDIMSLEFWLEKSEQASQQTIALDQEMMLLATTGSILKNKIESLKSHIAEVVFASNNFLDKQKQEILVAKTKLKQTKEDLVATSTTRVVSDLKQKLKKSNAMLDIWINDIGKTSRKRAEYVGELNTLAIPMAGSKCPTCLQKVDHEHAHQHQQRISVLNAWIKGTDDDLDMFRKFIVKEKLKIGGIISQLDECKRDESKALALTYQIKNIERQIIELKETSNPFTQLIIFNKQDLRITEKKLTSNNDSLKLLEANHEAVSFWIKGFKRIRLFIIEQAFRTLEVEVNNSLAQLGMPDWQITFDIERENKSGGITKGFVVFVKSPANTEPVRWENWSGGETQRLQLAGDLGLANLIMEQNGLSGKFEAFDEPSNHLSSEGMMDLANMLHERAINEGKRIWIADHSSITNFGEFEGVITARKDSNGTTIAFDAK